MKQIVITFDTEDQANSFMKAFEDYNTKESSAVNTILESCNIDSVDTNKSEATINLY